MTQLKIIHIFSYFIFLWKHISSGKVKSIETLLHYFFSFPGKKHYLSRFRIKIKKKKKINQNQKMEETMLPISGKC